MKTQHEASDLLKKYNQGTATPEEVALLESWQLSSTPEGGELFGESERQEDLDEVRANLVRLSGRTKTVRLWLRLGIAAAVAAIIISAGIWFRVQPSADHALQVAQQDVPPGKKGATLTLSDGRKIQLSEATDGHLAEQAGISITKTSGGQLVYEITESSGAAGQRNVLSTSNGETYQVRLPDGSLVALNAGSSLAYTVPLVSGGSRHVKLTGEAYFEIAKDAQHPFVVESEGQRFSVLGTHFNVNAYDYREAIITTLLEGSLQVANSNGRQVILKPGQQATSNNQNIRVSEVDGTIYTDWKDGLFTFSNEPIESVMKRIGRWYNVNVIYKGRQTAPVTYSGTISQYENLSGVLKLLEQNADLQFQVRENTITVLLK
ncbi:FecR family protein [Pedobacter deserti]|uniref:FecR family protein n=1 Tax=Pedobacter deserti TaxID=2817382 RepID=UPI00210B6802|nr:FecR family protein [Pedobacter sp. SYSU D00382]